MKSLGEFFDLINQKPLVDLKLDGLNGLPSSDSTSKHMFAKLCTTNTEVREKVKIEKVAQLMLLHKALKQRKQPLGNLSVPLYREVFKYQLSSH